MVWWDSTNDPKYGTAVVYLLDHVNTVIDKSGTFSHGFRAHVCVLVKAKQYFGVWNLVKESAGW